MAAKRHELNNAQWERMAALLPGKAGDPGRSVSDNRLNVCLWVLRSGAHWCDLPERFSRWCRAGIWERVFESLTQDRDNQYLMIDSTIMRAHRQAACGKGGAGSGAGAFPRRTDHHHRLADALGRPLRFLIAPGQAGDIPPCRRGSGDRRFWQIKRMTAMAYVP